jgi:hypothetical protein
MIKSNNVIKNFALYIIFIILITALLFLSCTISNRFYEEDSNVKKEEIKDTKIPVINIFTGPATTENPTIEINIIATDDTGITGWMITELDIKPSNNDPRWLNIKPTQYTFNSVGTFILYAWVKDGAGNISESSSITVIYTSNDTEAPIITLFSGPTNIETSILYFNLEATDDTGITGWLVTLNSNVPEVNASGWSSNKPNSYKFPCVGIYTLYAWAKDGAGNISNSKSITTTFSSSDNQKPIITNFTGPTKITDINYINITIDGTDNIGIKSWLIKETQDIPLPDDSAWKNEKPSSYIITKAGLITLYAWAKDEAGNISESKCLTVECIDNQPPIITSFNAPTNTGTYTFNIELSGTDNINITGWIITESPTKPANNDPKWLINKPDSYTLTTNGEHTLYAWAKDGAGNVSNSRQANVKKVAPYTIMIHFAIDNDLDVIYEKNQGIITNYLETLESIKSNDTNDNLQIVILMDCYNSSTTFKDGYYLITGGSFSNDLRVEKNEINSGNVNDINSFIDWAVTNYPAGKYIYSTLGTGSGFDTESLYGTTSDRGLAYDRTQKDSLSLYEISLITDHIKQKIGKKLEMFIAHAWLMGSIELAYELRNNVNYIISSEDISPIKKWSYESFLNLALNPDMSIVDFGKTICDSAYNYFSSLSPPENFTISLIDLSKINQLYSSIDFYSSNVLNYINNEQNKAGIFNNIVDISYKMCSKYDVKYYYVDFGNYLDNIINSFDLPSSIKNISNILKSNYNECIIYKKNYGYANATGLYIFHNEWWSNFQYSVN